MKNPKVAALLSLIFPGFGQLYIGQWINAIVFLVAAGFLWGIIITRDPVLFSYLEAKAVIVQGALIFIYLYSIFDAYRKTNL
jgi:TM2 domain-containing membrane protein YozV